MRIGLFIPTLNAGDDFGTLLRAVNGAKVNFARKLVIDSESADDTPSVAKAAGFDVVTIKKSEFNHGGTRQRAVEILRRDADVIVFLTQDVVICDGECFAKLTSPFADDSIGIVYGRQLPHINASPIARLLREFNYPAESCRKTFADRERMGIKTAFVSDTFAAYRVTALDAVGGFPLDAKCSEDMYVAGKMLMKGFAVIYNAEATVRHSHEFTLISAWRRYKDVGTFHAKEKWLGEIFGTAEGEGMKLLQMQLKRAYAMGGMKLAARIIFDDALKFLAYRVGRL